MVLFQKCRKNLALLWFIFSAIIFLLLFIQGLGEKHGNNIDEIWNWLIAAIFPSLSLIIGALVAGFGKKEKDYQIKSLVYHLTLGLSFFYLLVILLIFLVQPVTGKTLLELTKESSVYITTYQSAVMAMIGVFFTKK